ncbi:MAG: HD domain-containing protein [Actinobacteria bacterium]|nr:HD domain-containing protein [Actinomycetota bacterium]
MKKTYKNKRYIYDSLYGVIYLPDFIWDIITSPELQRLREVRLCNINSLCLTGGANINRYEHAIGTVYLAQECLNSWPLLNPISIKEQKNFLLAALLHDVTSASFGHSIEYIESKDGFEHERAFEYAIIGEKGASYLYKAAILEPIFFGMPRELLSKTAENDLRKIGEIISGRGRFGPLINSTIDLDNIDNVFRLGYHIGIMRSGEIPVKLAQSLYIENDKLITRKEAIPLIENWHKVRKKLYLLLLLNPEEFSGKCMLSEAIEFAKIKATQPFKWYHVDYEVLEMLSKISSESSIITSRLMKGDLYGCVGIFSTRNTNKYEIFMDTSKKRELEDNLTRKIRLKFSPRFKSAMVALHPIIDVNKTERQVCVHTDDGKVFQIGKSSSQLLIGIFFKNVDLSMNKIWNLPADVILKLRQEFFIYLSDILSDPNLQEVELYDEIKKFE